jgi:methylmalonyl-CoA/ethylmalonyl-CoA epimerase
MIKRIHHIAMVVDDMEGALSFWRDALGLSLAHEEEVPEQQARVAFLPVGEGEVELVKPTSDTSGMAKYLAKRGPGIHHVCVEVDNLAELLTQLKAKGVRLIDETPRLGSGGKKYAFIHPESARGVLVELYEL